MPSKTGAGSGLSGEPAAVYRLGDRPCMYRPVKLAAPGLEGATRVSR